MFVPRLHFINSSGTADLIIDQIKKACEMEIKCIHLITHYLSDSDKTKAAQAAKKITLLTKTVLLVDDLKLAALINADGVVLPYGDDNHGRAKDILGEEKLVGAVAYRIDEIAEYWEEGMADFIILESYLETDRCSNILGKEKAQTISDDARIMGYDIPILVSGGIDVTNAGEILQMGHYGLQIEKIEYISHLLDYLQSSPLR